eukprot:TRINITY_DN82356_c0_g1_i1.p1 TRINITY_DN82356_c0_g1~~TRINITY_DN82356_c0_g1_i1.p1  ORF type:complete len:289 (+),score=54.34 TRINITY_DN82356_c0_g1_i1:142-1008(+)
MSNRYAAAASVAAAGVVAYSFYRRRRAGAPVQPAETEWTVLYHIFPNAPFKGRGEFLKLMFEDAGVPYTFSNSHLYGPEGWTDMFRDPQKKGDGSEVKADTAPFPVMYPPVLWHRPTCGEAVMINQVSSCMAFIGAKLGYSPCSDAERARADCITMNAMDFITSGRRSFHPVDEGGSYSSQKEEGDRESLKWSQSKLHVWLQHFEKVVSRAKGKPVAGGPTLTYADFALFHVLDATEAQFNNERYAYVWDQADVPVLKAFKRAIEARPKLQAYFASERRLPWAGDSMM